MKFEYDPEKSIKNKMKHGIDFEIATALWSVPAVELEARTIDEPRFMLIGKIENKLYSCIYTVRGNDVIRLISVRRSRKTEEVIYHEYIEA